LGFRPFCG